jgi:hypothetical protein
MFTSIKSHSSYDIYEMSSESLVLVASLWMRLPFENIYAFL